MRTVQIVLRRVALLARHVVVTAMVGAGLVVAVASPAVADSGDGSVACNNGEICFQWLYGHNNYVKQFWNGANHYSNDLHGAYYFWDVSAGQQSSFLVMDNAEGLRNRDTRCTVYLFDVDSRGVWFFYKAQALQAGSFANIVGNRNNGHARCSSTSPVDL